MGSRAHGVDLARPLAVDDLQVAARHRHQARPRARDGARARRGAGGRRRTGRRSRTDAADRRAQRGREDRPGDDPRSHRARQPAADLRAVAARRDHRALRPVEPDRRGPRHHRPAVRDRRAGPRGADRRSGRGDLPLFRPHRVRRAGGRRHHHRRPRRDLARGLCRAHRATPRRNPRWRPIASAGASSFTAPIAPPASCCSKLHEQLGAGRDGTGINRWHAIGHPERRA